MGRRSVLDRPENRLPLVRLLAGGTPASELAAAYQVDDQTITNFARKYAIEIVRTRNAAADDAFAPLWVTDKANRVAVLQDDIDAILEREEDQEVGFDEKWTRVKHNALRQVADEMGQLPVRMISRVEGNAVVHVLEGVNLEALA